MAMHSGPDNTVAASGGTAANNSDLDQVFALPEIAGTTQMKKPPTATFDSIHELYDEDVAEAYNSPGMTQEEKLHQVIEESEEHNETESKVLSPAKQPQPPSKPQ